MKDYSDFLIEIDLDGVIADIYSPVERLIKGEGYHNFTFDNVKTYEAKEPNIGCPRVEMNKWFNRPEIYNIIEPYKGVEELISWLLRNKVKVVINTKSTIEVEEGKRVWIEALKHRIKDGKIHYIIETSAGLKKMLKNSRVLIEDSLENIRRSPAETKFLISRHHNKKENNLKYISLFEDNELYVISEYSEIKNRLKEFYPEVFIYE